MKNLYLLLLISFSLMLTACTQGVKSLSVMEVLNKDLIEDIKEESKEIIANHNEVQLIEAGVNQDRDDLELKFNITSKITEKNLEELSNMMVDKLKGKLDDINSNVTFSWNCKKDGKVIFYRYSIDGNEKVSLEENYVEETLKK